MGRRYRVLSCIGVVVALFCCSARAGAAQGERAMLTATPVLVAGKPRLLVSIINLSSQDLLVARRFLLKGGPASTGELWLEVQDDKGADVAFRCSTRAGRLLVSELAPLAPLDSVGRLMDLNDCFTLRPGKSYRITAHLQLAPRDPERLPRGKLALLEQLTAEPVEMLAPARP